MYISLLGSLLSRSDCSLTELDLSGNRLNAEGLFKLLSAVQDHLPSRLIDLNLALNGVTDAKKKFEEYEKDGRLKLSRCRVTL
jgi:hypothetical protein